jgi:hypothetical protein
MHPPPAKAQRARPARSPPPRRPPWFPRRENASDVFVRLRACPHTYGRICPQTAATLSTNRSATGACTARLRRGRHGPAQLHTSQGRRLASRCSIRRQRFNEAAGRARLAYDDVRVCSRTDGHTRIQPLPSLRRRVHHARVHPSIPPQVVLVGPEAPRQARWPVRLVHAVG